jgi:hypothetical protein
MPEYYFSAELDGETTLCISPITDKCIELSGEQVDDPSGYFLYQTKGGASLSEVEILARLTSEEAALKLKQILSME